MTDTQSKYVCRLSTGRLVRVIANRSTKNPSRLFGQMDTDPGELKQPELDEFLTWYFALEAELEAAGIKCEFRVGCALSKPWNMAHSIKKRATVNSS